MIYNNVLYLNLLCNNTIITESLKYFRVNNYQVPSIPQIVSINTDNIDDIKYYRKFEIFLRYIDSIRYSRKISHMFCWISVIIMITYGTVPITACSSCNWIV